MLIGEIFEIDDYNKRYIHELNLYYFSLIAAKYSNIKKLSLFVETQFPDARISLAKERKS